ncbi:MAG: hypothetical protein EYC70_06755 [Planctomycetota bacterium]|nr:MAG: hypothetical protein EYC70_06755 [Planctomycetota bacterium]
MLRRTFDPASGVAVQRYVRHGNLAVLLILVSSPLAWTQELSDWTVRELVEPQPHVSTAQFSWLLPVRMGDVDRDAYLDLMLNGFSDGPFGASLNRLYFEVSGGQRRPSAFGGDLPDERLAGVGVGHGPLVVQWAGEHVFAVTRGGSYELEFWQSKPVKYLVTAPLPSPPPGYPPIRAFNELYPIGDLNSDSYDELVFDTGAIDFSTQPWTRYDVAGVLDGATLSVTWQVYVRESELQFSHMPLLPSHWGDLDQDGVTDVVFLYYFPGSLWVWRAYSGRDGRVLWEFQEPATSVSFGRYLAPMVDVDGDSVQEILAMQMPASAAVPGYLRVMSGVDGHVVWENPIGRYDPCLGLSGCRLEFQPNMGPLGDWDRDGTCDIAMVVDEVSAWFPWTFELKVWIFSGVDGRLLARETLPSDLAPWHPDEPLQYPISGSTYQLMGDIDRDGWIELVVPIYSVSQSTSSVTRYYEVFLGRRTLWAPRQVRQGEIIDYGFDLPGAAGLPFQLLLSTEFGASSGFRIGYWNTALRWTTLTNQTVTLPRLQGLLGPKGGGEAHFTVPHATLLNGRDVYAVAVVWDPAIRDGVRTLSSIAITRIVP